MKLFDLDTRLFDKYAKYESDVEALLIEIWQRYQAERASAFQIVCEGEYTADGGSYESPERMIETLGRLSRTLGLFDCIETLQLKDSILIKVNHGIPCSQWKAQNKDEEGGKSNE